MISASTTGIEQTIARLQKQSAALKDLTPAYKAFGAEIVKKTDDGFQNSRGYDGEQWEPLAESTIENRVGSLKAANKRTKKGTLTKGATALQAKLRAPGGIKPLIDTARARNSNHATANRDGVEWSAVGYLGYSMSGTVKMPERNPTPFIFVGDEWKLRDSARASLEDHLKRHINGEP